MSLARWALVLGPFVVVTVALIVLLAAYLPSWWSVIPLAIIATSGLQLGMLVERHRSPRGDSVP